MDADCDESSDGPGDLILDDFLDNYGHIDGVARWECAKVHDPEDGAVGSDEGAGNAGGSGEDDDGAIGPHEDADNPAGSDAAHDSIDSSGADSGPVADGSDEGAGNAGGSGEDGDAAVCSLEDADTVA